MTPAIRVANSVTEGKSWRRPLCLQRFTKFEESRRIVRNTIESRGPKHAFTVDERVAYYAQRKRDPCIVTHAILATYVIPAAIFLTKIVRHVAHLDELVRKQVRIIEKTHDD